MCAMAFHEQVRFGDTAIVGQRELDGFVERPSAIADTESAKNTLFQLVADTETRPAPRT